MTRTRRTLAKLAMLALALPISATALAASDGKERQPEMACEVHKPATEDCHVHDTNTYRHMRMQERSKMGPHGRHEMMEQQRKAEQNIRH